MKKRLFIMMLLTALFGVLSLVKVDASTDLYRKIVLTDENIIEITHLRDSTNTLEVRLTLSLNAFRPLEHDYYNSIQLIYNPEFNRVYKTPITTIASTAYTLVELNEGMAMIDIVLNKGDFTEWARNNGHENWYNEYNGNHYRAIVGTGFIKENFEVVYRTSIANDIISDYYDFNLHMGLINLADHIEMTLLSVQPMNTTPKGKVVDAYLDDNDKLRFVLSYPIIENENMERIRNGYVDLEQSYIMTDIENVYNFEYVDIEYIDSLNLSSSKHYFTIWDNYIPGQVTYSYMYLNVVAENIEVPKHVDYDNPERYQMYHARFLNYFTYYDNGYKSKLNTRLKKTANSSEEWFDAGVEYGKSERDSYYQKVIEQIKDTEYSRGYSDATMDADVNFFELIYLFFSSKGIGRLFAVEIMPGLTIGGIIIIPVTIALMGFVLRLLKGRL